MQGLPNCIILNWSGNAYELHILIDLKVSLRKLRKCVASLESLSDQSSRSSSPLSFSKRLSPLTIIDHGTLSPLPNGSHFTSSSTSSSPTPMSSLSAFAAEKSIPETNCGSQKIRSSDDEDWDVVIETHAPSKTCVNKEESGLVANVTTDKVSLQTHVLILGRVVLLKLMLKDIDQGILLKGCLRPWLINFQDRSTKDKDKKSWIVCGKPDGSNTDERIHGYSQLQRPERKERASKA